MSMSVLLEIVLYLLFHFPLMLKDIKPTRMELIEVKKKIKLSESGHKLLKMKRDGLIIEFFKILEKAKDIRKNISADYKTAEEKIAIAKAFEGIISVKSAAFSLKDSPMVKLGSKNLMGVVVPTVETKYVRKKVIERGYGLIGTTSKIDDAAESYEKLVEDIILASEIETTMKRLLEDIEKTKRRVNALEFKVIPELKEVENFIRFSLEEMERENTFRLKRIKG